MWGIRGGEGKGDREQEKRRQKGKGIEKVKTGEKKSTRECRGAVSCVPTEKEKTGEKKVVEKCRKKENKRTTP